MIKHQYPVRVQARNLLCATIVAVLLGISIENVAHARQSSTRRDRRPDREVHIRYPQVGSYSTTTQTTRPTIRRFSPTAAGSSYTPPSQASTSLHAELDSQ